MSFSTSEQMQILMDLNKLSYSPPIDASMASRRQLRSYAFQPLNYSSGQVCNIQVNSGSDSISGPTSYIKLNLIPLVADSMWVSNSGEPGSAFNIFTEFQISHRSGDVMDRTDRINVLVNTLIAYTSHEYRAIFASSLDYGLDTTLAFADVEGIPYIYPLFFFSGLFAQKALLPAQLMAGSRLKIQLESRTIALVGGATSDYKISNMNLVLDSVDLFDSAKKVLLEASANVRTQGLQYPYHSWFHLSKSDQSSNVNMDINYSAAKTITLMVKRRLESILTDISENSFNSANYDYKNWRMRIGALTMPEFEVNSSKESYHIAVCSAGEAENDDLHERVYNHSGVNYTEYNGVHGVVLQSLEKNPIVGLSGEVTNNARLLNFSATIGTTPATPYIYDAYLKHLRVANVMMDNVVINR